MSPELTLYYEGYPIKDIAKSKKVTRPSLSLKLKQERVLLGLKDRLNTSHRKPEVIEFHADKHLVLGLLESNVSVCEIARTWDVCTDTVRRALKDWDISSNHKSLNYLTLSELYSGWADAPAEFVLSVNRKPTFKVIRL